jgi:hypothetical protein
MVIAMLCAMFVLSIPSLGCQTPLFRGVVLLLALANGAVGILLHYANALPVQGKARLGIAQSFELVGI